MTAAANTVGLVVSLFHTEVTLAPLLDVEGLLSAGCLGENP